MKIAHYDETTQKLLGWYDKDIHTTIPTPNIEVADEVWQTAINDGANHVNLDGTLDIVDFRTESEIADDIVKAKWNELNIYLSTLTVTTTATNKFDVSPNGLANITQRVNTMIDTDSDTWYEDWASFTVNKVELQEALVLQAEAKKAKITELFGVV